MNVPKLRFPEFRDTGEWEEKKLENIGEFTGGGTPSKSNGAYWDGKIPWISSSDILDESIYQVNVSRFITAEALQKSATKLVPSNSILLVSRVGVGKLAIAVKPVCTSQDFTNFTPSKDNLIFLAYFLKSSEKSLISLNQGTSIRGFTREDIGNFKISLPCVREQQKIADCLSSIDYLITAETQKLDTLKIHKKGLMQQLFPTEGKTLPKLRFPEFRDLREWEEELLGAMVEVASGQVDPTEPPYCDLPHIGGENIESHTGNLHAVKTARELRLISGKYLFNAGDVLYSKIRPALNKVAIPDFKGICSADIYPLRPSDDKLCRRYLAYLLLSDGFLEYATKHSDRSKIPKINRDSLLAYKVVIPHLFEQQRIADCIATLDDLITAQTQKIDTLKTHKKGMMQQLFPALDEVKA